MGKVREQIESSPSTAPVAEVSGESYAAAILFLARFFLAELDTQERGWEPSHDSATALGDDLYARVRDKLPEAFRTEVTGGQVMKAARLAFRAFKGD